MQPGQIANPNRVRYRLNGAASALMVLVAIATLIWFLSDEDALLAVSTAIVVAFVLDGFLADRSVRRVTLDLHHPNEVEVGVPAVWTARVHRWSRPITITPLLAPGAIDLLVTGDQPGALVWCPLRRGTVHFAVVDLKANGPLGLIGVGRRILHYFPAPLYVTPHLIESDAPWPRPRAVSFGFAEGAPAGDDLFRSIRPYEHGDERRKVDWKSTARHGQLMVRESEGTGVVLVRVVVDLGLPGPHAEMVAGVGGWIAAESLQRGWRVELVTLDAGRSTPRLEDLGKPFGFGPRVAPPPLLPLPTVAAEVRTAADIRRRLATTAYGSPEVRGNAGRRVMTCSVTPLGVAWT